MPVLPSELRALLGCSRGRRVLIVGDLMLDHFVIGRVERISPEAPVPVVRFDREEYRLGGAANVAHNVAALGGIVELAASSARTTAAGNSSSCCPQPVSTPAARRRSGALHDAQAPPRHDPQPAGRADRLRRAMPTYPERSKRASSTRFASRGRRSDVVLVSDYQKGVVTRVVARPPSRPRAPGIPLLVDPKVPHIDYYAGATPDHAESSRGGGGHVNAHPIERRGACRGARGFASAPAARACWSPGGARHVAARRRTASFDLPPKPAKSRMSPVPATPSSPRWPSASPPAAR